jgi:hypothetical protein
MIQWLFVGGPADGATLWVDGLKTVRFATDDGAEVEYRGWDYVKDGSIYRVGVLNPKDLHSSKIVDWILFTGVKPFGFRDAVPKNEAPPNEPDAGQF